MVALRGYSFDETARQRRAIVAVAWFWADDGKPEEWQTVRRRRLRSAETDPRARLSDGAVRIVGGRFFVEEADYG
jgi:hypothetical protein